MYQYTNEDVAFERLKDLRGRRRQADGLEVQLEGRFSFRFGANSAPVAFVALTADVLRGQRTPPDRFSYVSGNLN